MLIAPNNIETNKLVKKRRFNFDTANRATGNLILLLTDNYDDYGEVVTSKLFKPQQMFSVYSPRRVKPMNRMFVSFIQKDTYQMIREKTNSFIKIGKALPSSYAGRNLIYDTIPEYTETYKLLSSLKKSDFGQYTYMCPYLQNLILNKVDELNYEKTYIIFPMTKYIPDLKSQVQNIASGDVHSPVVEFLRALRHENFDVSKFERVDRIFFYCPSADAMVVMDPKDPTIVSNYLEYFQKINRLNNYIGRTDSLDDVSEIDVALNDEDNIENTKEKIKEIVLSNVSKKLKANLEDYDDATIEEKGIIAAIDKKIDSYLSKDENAEKPFSELVKTIESDTEVSTKAVNFVESKRLAQKQLIQLSKNLDIENEVIGKIDDLIVDEDKTFEPTKIQSKINPLINEKVQYSSLISMDRKYNELQAKEDLVSCITAFSEQDYYPITVVDWKLEDTSDDFTLKQTLSVRYKTDDGKSLSFSIDIPIVYNDHYIKVKGNSYIIEKQLTRLPIVKTKDNVVELTTNFNKVTCSRTNGKISRRNAYLKKILQKYKMNPAYNIEYGYNTEIDSEYKNDFEYEELASFLSKITTFKYEINTNRPDVEKEFTTLDYPDSFTITDKMTPVGFENDHDDIRNLIFIEDNQLFVARKTDDGVSIIKLADNLYTFIVRDIFHDNPDSDETIGKSYIYTNCKFIGVVFPIFVFCGLNIGITSILKKAKINYKVTDDRLTHENGWVEVRFKNKWFYYEDKIQNTLLLNVLSAMNTMEWYYEDFDTAEPYAQYCVDVLGQPIYVKQTVRINVSKLIDPMTRDVLNKLKLPTDPFSLLIMANNMLASNGFISKNDLCNYRIRGNELIYGILYDILASAYYKYQNAKLNGSNKEIIKIGRNELISTLISQQNINVASQLNPILEMESVSSCSMKGHKGINLRDAYTIELRSYDKSMNGILSCNATPFSGAVGIKRSLTVNPKINHVRGFIPTVDAESLDPTNRLSASEILSYTTATRADAPRAAMQVGQAKHGVPTYVSHKPLIGSGYDHTIPYMLSDAFCFKAKKAGMVESINKTEKIAILAYNDGTYDAIDLKENLAKNSNSGFYINQTYLMKYDVGETFDAGDVLAYNPSFFDGRGNDCALKNGCLSKLAISAGDFVFEDSTYISERLSEKCATDITMSKEVALGVNTTIHKMVNIGDHVDVNDELLNFTTSYNDSTTAKLLQDIMDTFSSEEIEDMGNEKVTSKYAGRVSDIDIYYNVPFETLSPSLQDLINKYNQNIESRKKELVKKGIHTSAIKLKAIGQQKETKINGTEFEGVLIVFYITHKDTLSVGDKLVYGTALKGIVTKVAPDDEAAYSEFRKNEIIDGCLACSGVPSRMTMDIFAMMYTNKALIELGRWIHDEWNK